MLQLFLVERSEIGSYDLSRLKPLPQSFNCIVGTILAAIYPSSADDLPGPLHDGTHAW